MALLSTSIKIEPCYESSSTLSNFAHSLPIRVFSRSLGCDNASCFSMNLDLFQALTRYTSVR